MNYLFQFDGLSGGPAVFDYSRFDASQLPSLDEDHLDESVGMASSGSVDDLSGHTTYTYCSPLFAPNYWQILDGGATRLHVRRRHQRQRTPIRSSTPAE